MNLLFLVYFSGLASVNVSTSTVAVEEENKCADDVSQYVFSWPISPGCQDLPRGGTSTGEEVEISNVPHEGWLSIQSGKLDKLKKDRAAILAMAGGYKVDFNFLETVGFYEGFKRDRPYHSWGTEYVYVVEDKPEFISLQHIMVMYFQQEDGTKSDPFIMKHWRQDWTYQDQTLLEYKHNNTWLKRQLTKEYAKGKWSQAVFQVDDSPRYESIGTWEHNNSFSTWLSDTTRRPLPRREYSVRNDYQVLEGVNRHTITRFGWVQEEENWKLALGEEGQPRAISPYLAKEEGVARYQLTKNIDFSAGVDYMQGTQAVWSAVRNEWQRIIESNDSVSLNKKVNGQPLFVPLFGLAEVVAENGAGGQNVEAKVNEIISEYLKD